MGKATGRPSKPKPISLVVHDRTAASFDLPANSKTGTRMVKNPEDADGGFINVTVSLRDDPLEHMRSIKAIDHAQFEAGRRWQADWEASEIGGAKGMDTTKEPVDGGGQFPEFITDRHLRATKAILDADAILGHEGKSLVRAILGVGMTLEAAGAERGLRSDRDRRYLSRRFREALETLAHFYNLTGKGGTRSSTIRSWTRPLHMCTA